jgi:putative endopeptidase
MYKIKKTVLLSLTVSLLTACNNNKPVEADKAAEVAKPDVLKEDLDTTVNPAADFFDYANGGWIKKNPIPGDQAAWGIGNLVIEENLNRLKEIADKALKANAATNTPEQQIGDFWSTAMDSTKLESEGLTNLKPYLDKVNAISDITSLIAVVSELKRIGSSTLFSDFVTIDPKKSDLMTYMFNQGGIGLPEREYYFKNDSSNVHIRAEYVKHITKILTMSGEDSAAAKTAAKNILALETKMAAASRKVEDLRDPYANYNKLAIKDIDKLGANIKLKSYLEYAGVKNIDSIIVGQPEFFKSLNTLLVSVPVSDWKNYVKYNLVNDLAEVLPNKFGEEAFNFNRLFSGAKVRRPLWKRSIALLESKMGELLGQLYIKEYFNEKTKKRYEDMTELIRAALKDRISKLTWMDDITKQKAYLKLAAMKKKVGYPDKWKDFSHMKISKASYLQNYVNANIWWSGYSLDKLGKPVNMDEWDMYPQTYNAYYDPSKNEIVLPAGIFTVPGYRDEELDDALVYGYGGASTIGHEITHGFDDQGRQYDAIGNLRNWWTKKDETEFTKRADVIIEQFNNFEPIKGYKINGKATQGENIADLGGILLGIEAFKKTAQYKEGKSINGLTPMQRYFLGYALGWLGHQREEKLKNRLMTDVHSPAKYRVNGPFTDIDEFYTTFKIPPGSAMYTAPEKRVRIW